MQDYSYFDTIGSEPQIDTEDEMIQLQNVANNIGSYLYEYTPEAQEQYSTDNQEHLGIIAQDLLKVPGLASAVHKDEYGNYIVDAQKVALAALGLVAALARKVIGETDNGTTSEELSESVQDTGADTITETAGATESGIDTTPAPAAEDDVTAVDTVEAEPDVTDNE